MLSVVAKSIAIAGAAATVHVSMIDNPAWAELPLRPLDSTLHALTFAVNQRNLDKLDSYLKEVSSPQSDRYGEHWTFEEIGAEFGNPDGCRAVKSWLDSNDISVDWSSAHCEYIKAKAPISKWEALLDADFLEFEHRSGSKMIRSRSALIPTELEDHIAGIFYLVDSESPPHRGSHMIWSGHSPATRSLRENEVSSTATQAEVDVYFLNDLYSIPSNIGNSESSQLVYESAGEKWSPSDLDKFQSIYGLTRQQPVVIAGENATICTFETCGEANLDIQYIMGVSQVCCRCIIVAALCNALTGTV
jgi:tripeptidyl-peptidase-1